MNSGPIVALVGSTDATGQFRLTIGVPALPPGVPTWNAAVQMAIITPAPASTFELSNPSVFTVVDGAF